jgi:hypothetical protein
MISNPYYMDLTTIILVVLAAILLIGFVTFTILELTVFKQIPEEEQKKRKTTKWLLCKKQRLNDFWGTIKATLFYS